MSKGVLRKGREFLLVANFSTKFTLLAMICIINPMFCKTYGSSYCKLVVELYL
jgi:hypothetical protein